MLLACEQVPSGPLGAGTGEPPINLTRFPEFPRELFAGYVTGCHGSKCEWNRTNKDKGGRLFGGLRGRGWEKYLLLFFHGFQSSPEKLHAITGREDSKREWKFVLELNKQKQRWRNFTCFVG